MPPDYPQEIKDYLNYVWEKKMKQEPEVSNKRRLFGAFKGKMWMSADFDEPLEDFKDYI